MALLTPEEVEYFEKTMLANATRLYSATKLVSLKHLNYKVYYLYLETLLNFFSAC